MRVLMFGWEFPPFSQGGLGTACFGIVKGLSKQGVEVIFIAPHLPSDFNSPYAKMVSSEDFAIPTLKVKRINSLITAYATESDYLSLRGQVRQKKSIYGSNLFEEVMRYSERAKVIAKKYQFDIIHAHDWMTYPAAIKAKKISGKKLVVHVHATEFDRSGNNPNPAVYRIERAGLNFADKIIAVSNYTKDILIFHYGVPPGKITVVHNAVDVSLTKTNLHSKTVLFLGRMTLQKGPDYFLRAAKKVLDFEPNTRFIMAGAGDMEAQIIEQALIEGIADKIIFTGYINSDMTSKIYKMASVYVMPSVSEPFGITALEAINSGVPVIISKQSGVKEIISHCLTVDFWDVDAMANSIVGVLRHSELRDTISENAGTQLLSISWESVGQEIKNIYSEVI